ncbi:hypothetical protein GJU40_16925 [Bacillus lacus]|uniref:Cobalamin adenosyltransferase-like domain-containing protein n=1 Tax=Metabacillus lacus TaxID=1983721 RepID=A0A7X2J392_9BACI|nr:hypothetical protein [Metabacillus lacus]MRX73828.1 hypothetical protein [Metabacillus lacus]
MVKKDFRYLCYPYMREAASTVDFEIRTDSLATRIGLAASKTRNMPELHEELLYLSEMAYHLNGSVRGSLAITAEDLQTLSNMYDYYTSKAGDTIHTFVLPQGTEAACVLHTCRSEAKKSVRALHKVSLEREVEPILFDYAHLLANVLFVMAVHVNSCEGVQEIPFISKSYKTRNIKKEENSK